MKRAVFLIIILLLASVAALSAHGSLTFVPVLGSAMEPVLPNGSVAFVQPLTNTDVIPGQIIVFRSPEEARDLYNYPAIAARRVTQTAVTPTFGYITSGDATGIDPVSVPPADVIGTAGGYIPWIGYPMLFFQSVQDMILVGIAYALLALFLYRNELLGHFRRLRRWTEAEIISVEKRPSVPADTALDKFAAAMADYARHLASHTSAIQGLSEASQELKRGAAEQNRVLAAMLKQTQTQQFSTGTRPEPPQQPVPEQAQVHTEQLAAPPPMKKTRPKRRRPVTDNERILNTLLRNIRDVREATETAPPIPEVTFTEGREIKPAENVISPMVRQQPEPRPVPGCARRRPFRGKHPHAS